MLAYLSESIELGPGFLSEPAEAVGRGESDLWSGIRQQPCKEGALDIGLLPVLEQRTQGKSSDYWGWI